MIESIRIEPIRIEEIPTESIPIDPACGLRQAVGVIGAC